MFEKEIYLFVMPDEEEKTDYKMSTEIYQNRACAGRGPSDCFQIY